MVDVFSTDHLGYALDGSFYVYLRRNGLFRTPVFLGHGSADGQEPIWGYPEIRSLLLTSYGITLAFVLGILIVIRVLHDSCAFCYSCFVRICALGGLITLVLGCLYLRHFQQFIGPAYPLRPLNCRWKLHAIICSRYPLLS